MWLAAFSVFRDLLDRAGGTRTPNPRFWRPVLYQLSYDPRYCPYRVSRCSVWRPHQRQYFESDTRSGVLRLLLLDW